jgi:hypothetical protein
VNFALRWLNMDVDAFITRWAASAGAERANYQLFLSELCDVLDVPRPEPTVAHDQDNEYVFERAVTFHHADGTSTTGRIDLYKRSCFVLEAKQGSGGTGASADSHLEPSPSGGHRGHGRRGSRGWDRAMQRAKSQAEHYVRSLPVDEGRPPFVLVVDVGHSIEVYSEFSRSGGVYLPFPDAQSHRIQLTDLAQQDVRDQLRAIWTDPLSLDPSRRSARVTRSIADKLARLARSLEQEHAPEIVSAFLMRMIFTMFAEDMQLLPSGRFRAFLHGLRSDVPLFAPLMENLWRTMNAGGVSSELRARLPRFNGEFFADARAVSLSPAQLDLLIEATDADWSQVEPAIFGTLVERALDPRERHKLGAHYTPRAYVERLVNQVVMEPLREEWANTQVEFTSDLEMGNTAAAIRKIEAFHARLCTVTILDPACGSGNFLYVALELMKRLEDEVFDTLYQLGHLQRRLDVQYATVDPHQFLGLELNPRAAAIAELVLWIGYLQWQYRTRGTATPSEPVLRAFHNIRHQDALLVHEGTVPAVEPDGRPVLRWDRVTTRLHPATGREVPDETAQVPDETYLDPAKAPWPQADFIIGNPPFLGGTQMRGALGHGYTEAVRRAYPDVPDGSDFVMYWWNEAAERVRRGETRQFGFITTNSISQPRNRAVSQRHLTAQPPLALTYAVPDHPWVDASDGAAVRIAMTVGRPGEHDGLLERASDEREGAGGEYIVTWTAMRGKIQADLRIGAEVITTQALRANEGLAGPGSQLFGSGFIVTPDEAAALGLGETPGTEQHLRPYRNGRDLTQRPRGVMVIDLFGLTADQARERVPALYQWVFERVKPERDQNNRRQLREQWWLHGYPRPELRRALAGLPRYIATVETAKHRFFTFLDASVLPDNMVTAFALSDAYVLGVLSSRIHVTWALTVGGTLEDRPRYTKSVCFEPFPFPVPSEEQRALIRHVAEQLDDHRQARLAAFPDLTMTGLYNVLEKLRVGDALTAAERTVNDRGLVSVLLGLHQELDAAVFDAYGWPATLTDDELLERVVQLNAARVAEEQAGLVRWLRPELQHPAGTAIQGGLGLSAVERVASKAAAPFPRTLGEQAHAIRTAVKTLGRPVTTADVAARFRNARRDKVTELLDLLVSLGQLQALAEPGQTRYAA